MRLCWARPGWRGLDGVWAIPFSPRDTGWLPAHAGNARKPRLTVTSRLWAVGFKTTQSSSGAQLSSCSGSLGSPCWWRQVHSLKQMYSPGGPSGPEPAAEGGESMATGVTGEPMGNQTHAPKANQTQTPNVKAAASSLCNKYCKAHLVSFQVKYND